MAQAQTQLTLFVDPQSISLECEQELHMQNWMSSKRNASMIIRISMGQEICLIIEQVSLDLFLLEEKSPDGYMWSGERLTRKQLTSRPDHLWPELWGKKGKNAKLEETNWSPFLIGSTNNGDQHRVLPLPGGNDKNPGGLPKNLLKVKKEEASKGL